MGSISFGGLATGLDTGAIIQQLLAIEARPLQRLESQRRDLVSKRGQFDTFKAKLQTLSDRFKKLKDDNDTLRLFKGSSTDEEVVKVSAEGAAVPGQFAVTVNSLAKAQSLGYTSQLTDADTDTFTKSGAIDISIGGGAATTINIDVGDTLQDARDKINAGDAGVRASIINDGTNFQLVISSTKTGTDNAFSLNATGFQPDETPFANTPLNLSAAANASFDIDGLSITSQSNKVTEAVEGVTFELVSTSAPGTSVDVSIARDNSAIGDKLNEVVEAYNDVLSFIDAQSDKSDIGLRSIKNQLRNAVSTTYDQADFGFVALAQVGIKTNAGGRLELDRGDLDTALDNNFEDVIEFFNGKADGSLGGIASVFDIVLNGDPDDSTIKGILTSGEGLLAARQESLSARIRSLDQRIDNGALRLERKETTLTRRFASFEELTSQYQAQGSFLSAQAGRF